MEDLNYVKKLIINSKKKDRMNSNEFSVFQYIDFHEVLMSTIFKDLLNPRGKHGQGSLFLDEFLHQINLIQLISGASLLKVNSKKIV